MNFWENLDDARGKQEEGADRVGMRRTLLQKQEGLCFWCRKEMQPFDRTLDHVLAFVWGGPLVLANLVLACEPCNARRGSQFSDSLLDRLPNSVLRLAIVNLQALPAANYEAEAGSDLARVLERRLEIEGKLQDLLIERLTLQNQQFVKDNEPALRRSREIECRRHRYRNEKDHLKLVDHCWKSKIGKRMLRDEKENNREHLPQLAGHETSIWRRRSAR